MRGLLLLCVVAALPAGAAAQVSQKDSVAKADSAAAADSIALVRELQGQTVDTSRTARAGPINARLLPDISVVGDMVADLSPKGSTQEARERFGLREIELAFQAAVDPYFRGDVFIGLSDEEGAAIEQAYLTATALPGQLEARIGRFMMPVGKQITTHRHDLHTIEYPYVIQSFFGPEGLKGTGVYASRVFSPFGFYQEVIGTVVDRIGEAPEDFELEVSPNRRLDGLGYSARLRNYFDISEAANIELSFSGLTGKREFPWPAGHSEETEGYIGRQSMIGADFTFRWRPLQQGLYKSFILQGELMRRTDNRGPSFAGSGPELVLSAVPERSYTGGYVFSRYQTSRRTFVAARYDFVEDPSRDAASLSAASGYFTFFPSEFSKLVAGYERYIPRGDEKSLNRFILQATFALGPHKPHPF